MTSTSYGLLCPFGCGWNGYWPWKKLDAAIISDGEGGLVWIWSCPMCKQALRTEPFAFPADMAPVTPSDGRKPD